MATLYNRDHYTFLVLAVKYNANHGYWNPEHCQKQEDYDDCKHPCRNCGELTYYRYHNSLLHVVTVVLSQ